MLATDLVDVNVNAIRDQVARQGLRTIEVRRADAVRLVDVPDRSFQMVLCLGPYYHLLTSALRRRCLLECRRVVTDQGVVAVSYIDRASAVGHLERTAGSPTAARLEWRLDREGAPADDAADFFDITHFSTHGSVEDDVKSSGMEVVERVATDGAHGFDPDALERLDDRAYQAFRGHHLATCSKRKAPGASAHWLLIARKA